MAVLATLVVIGLAIPTKIHSDVDETVQRLNPLSSLSETPTIDEVKLALVYVAKKYGINETQLLKTIQCESEFRYTAIGKAGEIGIGQFMPSTWDYWNNERIKKISVLRPLNIYSTKDQIEMLVWSWNKGYQNQWTCFRRL